MTDAYGSDFISITDESGAEYELEVLSTIEYNGIDYLAVVPADDSDSQEYQVSILRSSEENGEAILSIVEDPEELEAVNTLLINSLYDDEETK